MGCLVVEKVKNHVIFLENGPEGVYVDASMEDVAHPEKTSLDVLIILENSKSMEKFSHIVAPQLTQFVKCVEPLNWKVGILSSMWKKKGERNNNGGGAYSSFLMPMEKQGQISNKVWINSGTYDYQKIFFDTVSLNSGCSLPPYCIKRKE